LNETPHSIPIPGEDGRQNLQGNFAIKPGVVRQINLAHATLANLETMVY
jgi:hypothetical protein